MKKLLMLAAVAMMALGARAAHPYTWTIYITHLPNDLALQTLGVTLLDASTQPMSVYYGANLSPRPEGAESGGFITGTDDTDGIWAFATLSFQDDTIPQTPTLATLIEYNGDKKSQQLVYTEYSSTSGQTTLGATAKFGAPYTPPPAPPPTPTPEPTSAMLMLLGVAGLALKRKRA